MHKLMKHIGKTILLSFNFFKSEIHEEYQICYHNKRYVIDVVGIRKFSWNYKGDSSIPDKIAIECENTNITKKEKIYALRDSNLFHKVIYLTEKDVIHKYLALEEIINKNERYFIDIQKDYNDLETRIRNIEKG